MSEGNARVTEETVASSAETFGVRFGSRELYARSEESADGYLVLQRLNQHPDASAKTPWRIGVSSDPNEQCRRVDEE